MVADTFFGTYRFDGRGNLFASYPNELLNSWSIVPIKAIGTFFPLDNQGSIINDASFEKIPSPWRPVLQLVQEWYLEKEGDDLHSLYLRGSVPRGLAQDSFSDLDMLALVKRKGLRWEAAAWQEELEWILRADFPFVNALEAMLSSYSPQFFEVNPHLAMVLKTQSICLYGNDIRPCLPKFKPGKKMMLHFRRLESDLEAFLKINPIQLADCQGIMKLILRVGFELVMEREGQFTTDSYPCYRAFSNYYPTHESQMQQALFFYLNPNREVSFLKSFVTDFGGWMLGQVKEIIET